MAKKVVKIIKLQIQGGKATPAPPVGPALGAAGLNIMDFCNKFNNQTKDKESDVLQVVISVYSDRTFGFVVLQPPVSKLILKTLGIESGSKIPNREKVGKLTEMQVKQIAKIKISDVRAMSEEAAIRMIEGTARSMGVDIVEG